MYNIVLFILQTVPEVLRDIIQRIHHNQSRLPFSDAIKTFALCINFLSPKALEHLRKVFGKVALPCDRTMRNWDDRDNYRPGILDTVVDNLSLKTADCLATYGTNLVWHLTLDEMHIHKGLVWNTKAGKWDGAVDTGGLLQDLDKDGRVVQATKASGYVLVNINYGLKAPVAYYLNGSMNGEDKYKILKNLLTKLQEKNIEVYSLSFDGDSANLASCRKMGANFQYFNEKFAPYFQHPKTLKTVYVFFDACHMLKLVRNVLKSKRRLFLNGSDETIEWSHIKLISDKQEMEGLHLNCKIRKRHIEFEGEKMKVYLAAQVLSNSAACAIDYLDVNNSMKGTETFCKNVNEAFDVLNTRSKFDPTPTRNPINLSFLDKLYEKKNRLISYFSKLEFEEFVKTKKKTKCDVPDVHIDDQSCIEFNNDVLLPNDLLDQFELPFDINENFEDHLVKEEGTIVRQSVLRGKIFTGFLGFIIGLQNVFHLSKFLLENKYVEYLLTYRLSQDHVELLFALIRRLHGCNNNPTTVQFESAMRKIVRIMHEMLMPVNGNCIPPDSTFRSEDPEGTLDGPIILIPPKTKKQSYNNKMYEIVKKTLEENPELRDHDYCSGESWAFTEFCLDVVKYLAGAIVRSIISDKNMNCEICIDLIREKKREGRSRLIEIRDWGGKDHQKLTRATAEVELICLTAEKIFRQNKNSIFLPNAIERMTILTLKEIPHDILRNDKHFYQAEFLKDHRYNLMRLILQKFFNARFNEVAKRLADKSPKIRSKLTKIYQFQGQ